MAAPLLLLCAVLSVPASAETPFQRQLRAGYDAARASLFSHRPGAPTMDQGAVLPQAGDDASLAAREQLKVLLEQGRDVQEGCARPCVSDADIAVYSGKVDILGQRLGAGAGDLPRLRALYLPEGRPRVKPGAGAANPSADALTAEVTARLLQSQVPPGVRADLQRKALALADALGRTQLLTADADGVVTFADGTRRRLSSAQLQELNALPQAQSRYLRTLASTVVVPTPAERQAAILAEADRAVEEGGGTVADAYKWWGEVENDPSNNRLTRGFAWTMGALLTVSGLRSVESSAGRLGYVWDNPDVSGGQKAWMGTKLAGNMALTAVSFLPAASFAKSVQAGEGFYWIGRAGAAVPGVTVATREAATVMTAASDDIGRAIAAALPTGARVGAAELRATISGLNAIGSKYGVVIVEGGIVGESVAQGGRIFVSLSAGAKHEFVHVAQQFYSRILALENAAAQAGTTVQRLSAAQRAEAFAQAARWEAASYAQLEGQAFRATGFLGVGGGTGYTGQLLLTGSEVTAGLRNGAVLDASLGWGARGYGALTTVLGHSQYQIAGALGAVTVPVLRSDSISTPWMSMADRALGPLTRPDEPAAPLFLTAGGNAYTSVRGAVGPVNLLLPPAGRPAGR